MSAIDESSLSHTPRNLIFISHATPNDNALTIWLHSRLTAAGYNVWADVEKLRGGDPFWADIEHAIRHQAGRFLLVVTRTAVTRNGVLSELQEASNVAARLNDPKFIIPLRADGIPWSEFPIQIGRLNGLDFSRDWADGLAKLLNTLHRDNFPKELATSDVARVAALYTQSKAALEHTADPALLNWLPVVKLPPTVHCLHAANASESELRTVRWRIGIPHEVHGRLVISFAHPNAIIAEAPAELGLTERYSFPLADFLADRAVGLQPGSNVARNLISSMIRQGWAGYVQARGLKQHDETRHFVPRNWVADDRARYTRGDGTETYRALVGKALDHIWHFAIASKVVLASDGDAYLQVTPHVLFSSDGTDPYQDQKQLRRKHCKLWWNDAWRDRLQALLAALYDTDGDTTQVSLGGQAHMQVSTKLMALNLPVSYATADATLPAEDDDMEVSEHDFGDMDDEAMA